jgi:hypothetical protein
MDFFPDRRFSGTVTRIQSESPAVAAIATCEPSLFSGNFGPDAFVANPVLSETGEQIVKSVPQTPTEPRISSDLRLGLAGAVKHSQR